MVKTPEQTAPFTTGANTRNNAFKKQPAIPTETPLLPRTRKKLPRDKGADLKKKTQRKNYDLERSYQNSMTTDAKRVRLASEIRRTGEKRERIVTSFSL